MKTCLFLLLASLGILLVLGCGDSGRPGGTAGMATLSMHIPWPTRSRTIPAETNLINVCISGPGITTPIVMTYTRPSDSASTLEARIAVPAGPNRIISVTGHDNSSVAIAFGNVCMDLVPGESSQNQAAITLEGTLPFIPSNVIEAGDLGMAQPSSYTLALYQDPDRRQMAMFDMFLATASSAVTTDIRHLTGNQFLLKQDYTKPGQTTPSITALVPAQISDDENRVSTMDICFILDTTASMSGTLTGVVDSIEKFADSLTTAGYDLQLGAVTYGDAWNDPDGKSPYDGDKRPTFPLTADVSSFKAFVKSLSATGGGDGPECGLDALLWGGQNMAWRDNAKHVAIVLTDIESHQRDDGEPYSNTTADEVIAALKGNVCVFVVSPDGGAGYYAPGRTKSQGPAKGLSRKSRATTEPYNMQLLPPELDGIWADMPSGGHVDMNNLGITEYLINSYLLDMPWLIDPASVSGTLYSDLYLKVTMKDGTEKYIHFRVPVGPPPAEAMMRRR